MKTKIIIAGGFLGAGKTTLLCEAAQKLTRSGKIVGLITNDQAPELVDTVLLEHINSTVSEVSGSCFCCNFNGFTNTILKMMEEKQVDVIIAEPVGSCTDLSSTILQPLKEKFRMKLQVAPLTVLVDAERLSDIINGKFNTLHPSALYILQKQLEEADIIAINKTDLLSAELIDKLKTAAIKKWPKASVIAISARTGEGLDIWLERIMDSSKAGSQLLDIDYDTYAEGEAVLGWLNAKVTLKSLSTDWNTFTGNLLSALGSRFDGLNAAVGHLKLFLESGEHFITGNITGKKDTLNIRGRAGQQKDAYMIINARVQLEPDTLKAIVEEEIAKACGTGIQPSFISMKCLIPGRPNPTFRYDYLVQEI